MSLSLTRIRVGVGRFSDGWNVIVDKGEGIETYEPTFATEAEAEAKAKEVSETIRRAMTAEPGVEIL